MLAPSHLVNLVLNLELEPLTLLITSKKPLKKTQLERIRESISGLVDYSTLEPIQHFKFAPWNRVTPYSVQISELLKEEAALVYNSTLPSGIDDYLIYTDASSVPGPQSTGIRIGLVVLNYSTRSP